MKNEISLVNIIIISIVVAVLIGVALAAYGFEYVWYRSTGFREQNEPSFKPQETRYPGMPVGTVSTAGNEPPADTRLLARQQGNPIPPTAGSLSQGEALFMTYCKPCHGKTGDGTGIMGSTPVLALVPEERKKILGQYLSGYMAVVPDIDVNYVQHESEGDLYYTITNGGQAIMPGFKDALSPEQRWHLINFIKIRLGAAGGR